MRLIGAILLLLIFTGCEDKNLVPKPSTYLETDLPDHLYSVFEDSCGYVYQLQNSFKVETAPNSCNRKIDLGPLNGTMFVYYWNMDKPLSFYVNNANDEVGNHKLKARKIEDERIIRSDRRVFGTLFSLQGDVATPYQFYLTDSTDRFLYAEILFNSTPNYDSLKPSLDYLKIDLDTLIQTFEWK